MSDAYTSLSVVALGKHLLAIAAHGVMSMVILLGIVFTGLPEGLPSIVVAVALVGAVNVVIAAAVGPYGGVRQ